MPWDHLPFHSSGWALIYSFNKLHLLLALCQVVSQVQKVDEEGQSHVLPALRVSQSRRQDRLITRLVEGQGRLPGGGAL